MSAELAHQKCAVADDDVLQMELQSGHNNDIYVTL
jgi:hypothetical protein